MRDNRKGATLGVLFFLIKNLLTSFWCIT
jgi:hypothetical protein